MLQFAIPSMAGKGQLLFCLLFLFCQKINACTTCVDRNAVPSSYTESTYSEASEYLENPHRGFMTLLSTKASHHSPLTKGELDNYRHRDGITSVQRLFYLDTFVTSPISNDYLTKIRHDLDVIDSASFSVILRFAYVDKALPSHPYGDASKNIVLQHIQQLKPIFQHYEGIITAVQAGFIGAWGEWHHTEHFGNPQWSTAGHDPVVGLLPQAWTDRRQLLDELLHAVPTSIPIELRTPAFKMHMLGTTPSSIDDVQQGDAKGRTGHHNDCFLADDNDVGTYVNKATEYPYLEQDTRYTSMGGETCGTTSNGRHECPTARRELAMFHWTYLNEAYDQDVYVVWKRQGCYNEIHRKLGYRLSIDKAILPNTARVNDYLCFILDFTNHGYAAPLKKLQLYLILASSTGQEHWAAQVPEVEVRSWQPGSTHTVASAVRLVNVPEGDYKIMLQLRDPIKGDHPDYNVLLASGGVPLAAQGLNDLGHTVQISGMHTVNSDCPPVTSWHMPTSGHYSRVFSP